jgi:hypothetical protein
MGTLIHELSHAIFCALTGAKITEFKVFSNQPHICFTKPKIPIIGNFLVSMAPTIGGLIFLYILNYCVFSDFFSIPKIFSLKDVLPVSFQLIFQINLFEWQSWVAILLFLNIGAMIGPSFKDLKNIWPLVIIAFFFDWPPVLYIFLLATAFIIVNIFIQIILFSFIFISKNFLKN